MTQWGAGEGRFGGPAALAATASAPFFVSDDLERRAPNGQGFGATGGFLLRWDIPWAGEGQSPAPAGIAVGPSGTVYVADSARNRIQRFGPDGALLGEWGAPGSGEGQFAAPWGVATDDRGRVYVVDYGNSRIQRFGPEGDFLGQWGSYGSGKGRFRSPSFIATDSDGHVYVADSGNGRIQKFDANGRYLRRWVSRGSAGGAPDYPLGVATSPKGDVYVVGTNEIRKYDARGRLLTSWGGRGTGEGRFRNPQGIAADGSGNVYVGDSGNDRIQKFHDSGGPYRDRGAARLDRARSPARARPAPRPPRIPRSFTAKGRYLVPDLSIDVPFKYHGSDGNSKMVAGGPAHPIWFVNLIYGEPGEAKRLYTVTHRWPGVVQAVPCGPIPGDFSRRTLNAWLARSSFVGREVLRGERRRRVNHWRVTGVLPALPPGNLVRVPLALADIYVDTGNRATIRKVLHFGVQNLYDPELDEWFELHRFSHRPTKVTLPSACASG